MLAQYTSSPLYPGNPYIEALPPMMVGRELASALAFLPAYSPSDRERPAGERLQLLSQLYSIYQPLPMTIELYCQIYSTMLHSYSTYTPITEAAYAHAAYASIRSGANAASIPHFSASLVSEYSQQYPAAPNTQLLFSQSLCRIRILAQLFGNSILLCS